MQLARALQPHLVGGHRLSVNRGGWIVCYQCTVGMVMCCYIAHPPARCVQLGACLDQLCMLFFCALAWHKCARYLMRLTGHRPHRARDQCPHAVWCWLVGWLLVLLSIIVVESSRRSASASARVVVSRSASASAVVSSSASARVVVSRSASAAVSSSASARVAVVRVLVLVQVVV